MTAPSETVETITAVSKAMGKSRKTVYQWKDKGMPIEKDGKFNLAKISQWRAAWDVETLPEGNIDDCDSRAFWDREFRKWRSKVTQLDYQTKKGDLIPRADVSDMLVRRAAEFKRELLDRARRLALRCSHKDSKAIHEIIEADSIAILEKYSR